MEEKQIIYFEDAPKDWEEELALGFREMVGIDKNILAKALKNTTDKLNENFNKYNINFNVTSDLKSYIDIEHFKKLKINCDDNCVFLNLYNYSTDDDDIIFIRIKSKEGVYSIEYANAHSKTPRVRYNIDEFVIEKLFGELFWLNTK